MLTVETLIAFHGWTHGDVERLTAAGFSLYHTGGGCTAFIFEPNYGGRHALLTFGEEATAFGPIDPAAGFWLAGLYDADGGEEAPCRHFWTLWEAVAYVLEASRNDEGSR
jgi:hypothetical protein